MTSTTVTSRWSSPVQVASRLYRASGVWGWSLASMGISSVTSFTLSLLAGRLLGADGLGLVFVGFTAYFMLLTFHRALITKPLIATSSASDEATRSAATCTALTISLGMGMACGLLLAVVGVVADGPIGTGLLLFAPWLVAAFAQDLFRSSLVRDGHARRAALCDLAWFCTLLVCVVAATRIDAAWAVVAAWGLGGVVAAGLGAVWSGSTPTHLASSWAWFRRTALPFGRWLAVHEGVLVVGFFVLYITLAAILGVGALGGLRAAESVFAPFTLLAPALTLAGLPAVSRAFADSHAHARRVGIAVSGLSLALTFAYAGIMLLAGARVLTMLFGDEFEDFADLVVPMSVGQVALAAGLGFSIVLHAEQRGREILLTGIVMVSTSLSGGIYLATRGGLEGAVWGLSGAAAVTSALAACLAIRHPREVT